MTVLDTPQADGVRSLLLAASKVDGRPEVTGDELPKEFRGGEHLLARGPDAVLGYAHLNTEGDAFGRQVVELIVHPDHRRQGIGARLTDAVLDRAEPGARFWSHGDHPAAARIAEQRGLSSVRELLQLGAEPPQ